VKKSIFYVCRKSKKTFIFDGKEFIESGIKKSAKLFHSSRASCKDIISHSFKIGKNISEDEIAMTVEVKMYEEAGLSFQKSYKIIYLKKDIGFDDTYLIEAFAVEKENFLKIFKPITDKIKYIDYIALPFLAYETLYANSIIKKKNDLFIYLGDDEAFATLYKEGSYISTKSIITLSDITKTIKEKNESIDLETLKEILKTKGLKKDNYTDSDIALFEMIRMSFINIFDKINNIIMHNRSIFGFEKIDRIYFGLSGGGNIEALLEFITDFGIRSAKLYNLGFLSNDTLKDPLESIVTSYIFDRFKNNDLRYNLTIFEKKPNFFTTYSGKISLAVFATLLLLGSYSIFWLYKAYLLQEDIKILKKDHKLTKLKADKIRAKAKNIQNKLSTVQKKQKDYEQNLQTLTKITESLHKMKPQNQKYTALLIEVNSLLKKYRLSVTKIEQYGEKDIIVDIVAKNRYADSISKFIKDLLDRGYSFVSTNEIKLNDDIYISSVKIAK